MPASRSLRLVAGALAVAAIGVLVAVRVSGGADGTASDATAVGGRDGTGLPAGVTTTSGPEAPLPDPPSEVTADTLAGIAFTDVTEQAGLSRRQSELALTADMSMTSGAAVADVDRDGDLDVYVTRVGLPNSLYVNDGTGTFTDRAEEAGVARTTPDGPFQGSGAAAFADVDGDGCVDLYVAGAGGGQEVGAGEAALFVNDCDGRFDDQTAARGVSLPATAANLGAQGHGVTFADYDRDGFLDLLVLHWDPAFLGGNAAERAFQEEPEPDSICDRAAAIRRHGGDRTPVAGPNRSRLFRNDGTGHFTDVTAAVGLPLDTVAAFTGEFVDIDADGWDDLLLAGDFCTSRVFRNEGGARFVDVTSASGTATDENGMGAVVRDVDGDGRPDWFVTSIGYRTRSGGCPTRSGNTGCSGNRLYLNLGDGRFEDATDRYGVRDGWWGWGAAIEDFGNDGRLQIAQATGYVGEDPPRDTFVTDPLRFWVSPPGARKVELAEGAGPAGLGSTAVAHALVPFDHDGDGDLDLLIANFGDAPVLYRNDTPARHWARIRLDDPTRPGNRDGIGARVRVTPSDGAPVTGWISTGGSYESQKPPELHVGLGDGDDPTVDVEVWWPGSTTPQRLTDVAADRVITVVRSG